MKSIQIRSKWSAIKQRESTSCAVIDLFERGGARSTEKSVGAEETRGIELCFSLESEAVRGEWGGWREFVGAGGFMGDLRVDGQPGRVLRL